MNTIIALSIALCVCVLLMFVGNKYLNYKNGGALKVHENAIYNGCYRARQESPTKYMGRQGVAQVRQTKYKIFGTEKWNIVEVFLIYIITIAIVIGLLLIYNVCKYFF